VRCYSSLVSLARSLAIRNVASDLRINGAIDPRVSNVTRQRRALGDPRMWSGHRASIDNLGGGRHPATRTGIIKAPWWHAERYPEACVFHLRREHTPPILADVESYDVTYTNSDINMTYSVRSTILAEDHAVIFTIVLSEPKIARVLIYIRDAVEGSCALVIRRVI